jgi:hypothetical protein
MVHLTFAHQRFLMALAIVGSMILAEPMARALRATHGKGTTSPAASTLCKLASRSLL